MTNKTKSIVLISKNPSQIPGISDALRAHRQFEYEECDGTLTEMNGRASKLAATHDLILFQTEATTENDVAAIKSLREKNGSKAIILALSDANTTLADAQLLTRAGVDGVLAKTISSSELEIEIRRRLRTTVEAIAPLPENKAMGKVISVAQARGGIGATMLAVNLANHLLGPSGRRQKQPQNRVVLVDLDLQFGAISGFLDVKPNETFYQLAMDGSEPDATFLSQAVDHMPSGLAVLASPSKIAPLEALQKNQIEKLLETLRGEFDYVVIDMPRALVAWLSPVLRHTDRMFLLSDSSVPAIQKARRLIDFYTEDHLGLQIDIVINYEKKPLIQGRHHKEAAKALERPLRYWLPFQPKAAREAVDRGVPLSDAAGSSALNKSIKRLAKTTAEELARSQQSAEQIK